MTQSLNTGRFVKRPVEVTATQWFKNGDHPEDNSTRMAPEVAFCEGEIVRYFRHPDYHSLDVHEMCGFTWHAHGWIDTLEGGHTVCPGDWVITGVKGEYYPCKPDIFEETYERVSPAPDPSQLSLF